MKLKITRTAVITGMILLGIIMIFTAFWLFNDNTIILNDESYRNTWGDIRTSFGWIHMAINLFIVIGIIIWAIYFIWELGEDKAKNRPFGSLYTDKDKYSSDANEEEAKPIVIRWKRWLWIAFIVFLVFQIFKFGRVIYRENVSLYNQSKLYHNTYQQKVEEKLGFYDKLWKTYLQKEKITNINKDVFIQVTKIIMNNVADGQNLSWKWVSQYPDIDYNKFSAFYADLSDFITEQREGYFSIEKTCQQIANQNNTMLDTFPNNIYNRMLKLKHIKFEYGFLSDSTDNVFRTKKENLK